MLPVSSESSPDVIHEPAPNNDTSQSTTRVPLVLLIPPSSPLAAGAQSDADRTDTSSFLLEDAGSPIQVDHTKYLSYRPSFSLLTDFLP